MPETPTSPISPTGSGPSSVRAIVNWLETSGTSSTGGSRSNASAATSRAAASRGIHTQARDTAASPPPAPPPVSKLSSPPPAVATPPSSCSKSNAVHAVHDTIEMATATESPPANPVQPLSLPSPPPPPHQTRGATQDYSKTLLRYQAFISQAQSGKGDVGETRAAGRSGLGKKKSYGDLGRRTAEAPAKCHASTANSGRRGRAKNEVDAYWTSVRAQLSIADEDIYGS